MTYASSKAGKEAAKVTRECPECGRQIRPCNMAGHRKVQHNVEPQKPPWKPVG